MINLKDFLPKQLTGGTLFATPSYEPITAILGRVNEWVSDKGVRVVNIETIMVPYTGNEQTTTDTLVILNRGIRRVWYQFIRLWYQE